MRNQRVIQMVMTAMFIAMVYVATYINVPFPGAAGGLVHLGTLMMLVIAMRFGKLPGAFAGGVGMALFDLFSPYSMWALGTLVVRFAMGYVIGLIAYDAVKGQGGNIVKNVVAWVVGLMIMIVGYYLYEAIFLTTFEAALASIWGNIIQFLIGIIAFPVVYALQSLPTDMLDQQ